MNFRKLLFLGIFLFGGFYIQAQSPIKTHNHQDLLWLSYFPKLELDRHWSVDADFQFRRKDWGQEWSQKVLRLALAYKLNENIAFSAGMAHLQHHKNGFIQGEYRPFQQLILYNNFSGVKLDHRYRLEQRWIQRISEDGQEDGYAFNYRIRYKLAVGVPLKLKGKETRWSLYADNEIMVNFGEEVFINLFDQNRFSFGIGYQVNKDIKLQLGYMNIFAQKARLGEFDDANIIRLGVYQKLKLNQKKEGK